MATTTRGHEINREQLLGLRWLPFVHRAVFLRSAIVAVVIGSVLTLINQSGWVVGSDPLQILPFILVVVTPFVVVTISQVAAVRRAFIDAARIMIALMLPTISPITTALAGIPCEIVVAIKPFGLVGAPCLAASMNARRTAATCEIVTTAKGVTNTRMNGRICSGSLPTTHPD